MKEGKASKKLVERKGKARGKVSGKVAREDETKDEARTRQGQARRAALGALEKTAHELFILVKGKASNRLIGKT